MILKMTIRVAAFAALILLSTGYLSAQDSTSVAYSVAHSVITQGNGKLAIVDKSGKIDWQMKWGGIHDIHMLKSGNILTRQGRSKVVEIDREKKQVVWSYDSAVRNGNEGKPVEVHAFQPLASGHIMIAESGPARIIEVNRAGEIQAEVKLTVDKPHPHMDTRLVRKISNGNYLVCHEGDGKLREYNPEGKVVWEYQVPTFGKPANGGHGPKAWGNKLFSAVRLANGNTLIATGNGHSVIEVTPEKQIVWHLKQNDLPNITLAWVTTLEVLANGNYVIGNCHAGPGQPLLVEIEPKSKKVVWTFDQFNTFGNSVSNSQLLDVKGSLR
jgi:outer membrane protein assembly factor BamB